MFWTKVQNERMYKSNCEFTNLIEIGKFYRKCGFTLAKTRREVVRKLASFSQQRLLSDVEKYEYANLQNKLEEILQTGK